MVDLMTFALTSEGAGSSMSSLISTVTESANMVFSLVGEVGSTIVGTPLLLLTSGFLVVGGAVGIFSRMLRK